MPSSIPSEWLFPALLMRNFDYKFIEPKARILLWDIETSHLKADFGTVLCCGWKWLDEKRIHVPAITDYRGWDHDATNDKNLIRDFAKVLTEADIWVTYYGKGFDVPYIQAKLLEHGLPFLPNTRHVDLFFTVKHNMAISRKSLANVSWFLRLNAKKTPVDGRTWKKAMTGHKQSIKYVVDHCYSDVELLEEAYLRLRPLVRMHPLVAHHGSCQACGEKRLVKKGFIMTSKKIRQRFQCQTCGHWSSV